MRSPLHGIAQQRFAEIAAGAAADSAEWRWFAAAIGAATAASRAQAALDIAGAASVVDVGCGPVVFYQTLLAHPPAPSWTYTGTDASPEMVAEARRRLEGEPGRPQVLVAEIDQLPLEDRSADAVVVRHVFEHLEDPLPGLRECARVCRQHLVIVLSQYLAEGELRLLADLESGIPRWSHPRRWIYSELAAAGFSVEQHRSHDPARWRTSRAPDREALQPREAYLLARRV